MIGIYEVPHVASCCMNNEVSRRVCNCLPVLDTSAVFMHEDAISWRAAGRPIWKRQDSELSCAWENIEQLL